MVDEVKTETPLTVDMLSAYGPLITADEFAEILHATPVTIRNLRKRGLLPPVVRPLKHLLWRKEDVVAWINDNMESAGDAQAPDVSGDTAA